LVPVFEPGPFAFNSQDPQALAFGVSCARSPPLGSVADFRASVPVQGQAVQCADQHEYSHGYESPLVGRHVVRPEHIRCLEQP